MTLYARLVAVVGRPLANIAVIGFRAVLIAAVIFMADKGFTSFSYLQGG
jgi:hypothetical protein